MRKQKIKPGSFQDRAESKFRHGDKIDLKTLWNEDVELEPSVVEKGISERSE